MHDRFGLSRSVLLVAALLSAGQAALAQPAPAPQEGFGDAKELMELGVKLVKSKDYLGALAVFKDAYQRFPSAKILLNIGTTLKLLGRTAEAMNAYQRYLDSQDADPTRTAKVAAEISQADMSLGRLEIDAPAEAEIQVNSEDWVPAAVAKRYRIAPGHYTLRARRKGFQPFERTGELTAGQVEPVAVQLVAEPEPVTKQVIVTVPATASIVPEQPRSRLSALVFGHFDITGGAAAFIGAAFDVTERLQVRGAGIIGPNFGGFAGANFALLTGTLRPFVAFGIPLFFNDGARIGLRGAGGLEIVANRHFAVLVELGVEHNLNPQMEVEFSGALRKINSTAFIPALGVSARL